MNVVLRAIPTTRGEFFAWAKTREGRYEFDGNHPVAMTGANGRHNAIAFNLWLMLGTQLRGSSFVPYGADMGVGTVGEAVRFPDALVTQSRVPDEALTASDPIVVFEVVSPSSGRTDRIDKVREYAALPTVQRYVLIERTSAALTSFQRTSSDQPWTATTHLGNDALCLPEIGIELQVSALYEGLEPGIDDQGVTPLSD